LDHRGAYDMVVSNPPFHTTRDGNPDLGRGFIATAARILKPRGQLLMVANRHLPYEAELDAKFGLVEELPGSGAFKIIRASRPKR
jgi:16S rRNA (guanine1207-N2)-methyltransferase